MSSGTSQDPNLGESRVGNSTDGLRRAILHIFTLLRREGDVTWSAYEARNAGPTGCEWQ